MSQNLQDSDFMILKRCCEVAKELGGLDMIRSNPSVGAQFKSRTIGDFRILIERYGLLDAADLLAKAIRAHERANVTVH